MGIAADDLVILPNSDRAVVDEAKVRDYLLSTTHLVGYTKARFFGRLGFSASRWKELQAQLLLMARDCQAEPADTTTFGQKYHVRGIIRGPSGRVGGVLSVWIVRHDEDFPRLVAAIPVASI